MTGNSTDPATPIASDLVDDDESFAEIVEQFVQGLQKRVDELVGAVQSSDHEQLRALAHRLKGSAGGYGYPVLTQKASELEEHAREQNLDAAMKDLAELQSLVRRVVTRAE
jgi:HPt (histidine-containing phosphotransfer) domain-containing protein